MTRWSVLVLPTLVGLAMAGCGGGSIAPSESHYLPEGGPAGPWPPVGSGPPASVSLPAPSFTSAAPPQPILGGDDALNDALAFDDTSVSALAGNTLYYLSGTRGLLVFDVSSVDQPKLVSISPMSGAPQALYVSGTTAIATYADTYATTAQGQPFHGSLVRAVDCSDPAHPRVGSQIAVEGYLQASSLSGGVLYTGSTARDSSYAWSAGTSSPHAVVTSIAISGSSLTVVAQKSLPGTDGVFAFGPKAVVVAASTAYLGTTSLTYVDRSDPQGGLTVRGTLALGGFVTGAGGYCGGNAGWSLDFTDGAHARAITESTGNDPSLVTVDFTSPDAPSLLPGSTSLSKTGDSQGVVPGFDGTRLYVGHTALQSGSGSVDVWDLSNPASPALAGSVAQQGDVCSLHPVGTHLLATSSVETPDVVLAVTDVDATKPSSMVTAGSATLQAGRDVFPSTSGPDELSFDATGTHAAALVTVNPPSPGAYTYGVSVLTLGAPDLGSPAIASVPDPVQHAVFVHDRVYAFTSTGLSVFDVSAPSSPRPGASVIFAPSVVQVLPVGSASLAVIAKGPTPAQSTDVRVVPLASAADTLAWMAAPSVQLDGTPLRTFVNGSMLYVVTTTCVGSACSQVALQFAAVDVSGASPVVRGKLRLSPEAPIYQTAPAASSYGWYVGPQVLQVAGSTLASRPATGPLTIVDFTSPGAPTSASLPVVPSGTSWWGNLRVLGDALTLTTYTFVDPNAPDCTSTPVQPTCRVAYYVVPVDLLDPAHPQVGPGVNVPGIPFATSAQDPARLYLVDYSSSTLDTPEERGRLVTGHLGGGMFTEQGADVLSGLPGQPVLQGNVVFASLDATLHSVDWTSPSSPVDTTLATPFGGLEAVAGNAIAVASGWSGASTDIFAVQGTAPPKFVQTARAWWDQDLPRLGSTLYLASQSYGVTTAQVP